ncbi:uncharacterized protein LOC131231710 [Magnolia sinica]|uniref:uncharacterized protein LOC131231710 n=1 Tax=Magnolia sinica TaxID=86752 RepID=UPI002657ADDD|nr:uncharacterized protein LOC131231710 [Magnolia sinica]
MGWSSCGFICSVKFPNPRDHYDALILRDHPIWTLKTRFSYSIQNLQMKVSNLPVYCGVILLYLHHVLLISSCISLQHQDNNNDVKVLNVGEELRQEQLPFRMGYRLYQLHGLKASMWYEVKISYPASIPASFSIQLKRDKSDLQFNMKRRLLNTEKLIFKADSNNMHSGQGEVHVLVIVEPAGVVAKPHVHERQFVIFNIVCDELSFGIPRKAWWVGMLAFLCLGVALVIPNFLPSFLLFPRIQSHDGPGISKGS